MCVSVCVWRVNRVNQLTHTGWINKVIGNDINIFIRRTMNESENLPQPGGNSQRVKGGEIEREGGSGAAG